MHEGWEGESKRLKEPKRMVREEKGHKRGEQERFSLFTEGQVISSQSRSQAQIPRDPLGWITYCLNQKQRSNRKFFGILSLFLPGSGRRSPTSSMPVQPSNHPQPLFPSEAWHFVKIQGMLALMTVACYTLSIPVSLIAEAILGLEDLLFLQPGGR